MAIRHEQRYGPYNKEYSDPVSSPAAFMAALALLMLLFLTVVLLWAPWSGAGDTSGTSPQTQPVQIQPSAPVQPGGIMVQPSAPPNPGSAGSR